MRSPLTAKAKGIYMLSGYDDAYRVYSNNMTGKPWVTDKVVHLDDQIKAWIKATKTTPIMATTIRLRSGMPSGKNQGTEGR
jgi:hypothetical protein